MTQIFANISHKKNYITTIQNKYSDFISLKKTLTKISHTH